MRELAGRAEALSGTLNAQPAGNLLWAACLFSTLRSPGQASRWVHVVAQRLASLGNAVCLNTDELRQVHQFFVCCSVEPSLCVEEIKDMGYLREACRAAFEGSRTAPLLSQQQVSERLRHMGLSVKDEVFCPKSGYSIDMIVHDSGRVMEGERSSIAGMWAVEFDGPWHFLTSRAPNGATLLKRIWSCWATPSSACPTESGTSQARAQAIGSSR
jgi:hypothetical protein